MAPTFLIEMPYRVQLFLAGDELSRAMFRIVDKITRLIMEKFGPKVKLFSKDYIAYVLTSNTLTLNLKQGTSEVVQIEVFFALEAYREELKARFDIVDFPAAKFDGKTYIGREALEATSRLYDVMSGFPSISDDELLAEIKNIIGQEYAPESRITVEKPSILSILQKGVEPAVRAAGKVSTSLARIIIQSTTATTLKEEEATMVTEKPQFKAEYTPESVIDKATFERNVVRAGIAECLAKLEKLRGEGRIDEAIYRKMKEVYNSFLGW